MGETFPKVLVLQKLLSKGPRTRLDLFTQEQRPEVGNSDPGKCGIGEDEESGGPGGGVRNAGKIPGILLDRRLECDCIFWI